MNNTPQGNRVHIGIFGETNAGKSTLFNTITNTDISIVSKTKGTTTDPVKKAMELLPFGPVMFVDTAGLNDTTELGEKRIKKTYEVISKIDYGIYVADINNFNVVEYEKIVEKFEKYKIHHTLVFSKCDIANNVENIKKLYSKSKFINTSDKDDVDNLKDYLVKELQKNIKEEKALIGSLMPKFSKIILVAPQDSEAPKGRLILPQAQLIRDCIDNNILCTICDLDTLPKCLKDFNDVDLVVTDSQVFKEVDKLVPKNILLTSFSILYANQKGEIEKLLEGIEAIKSLKENDSILISEVCTHNISHEDIGRYKIPKMLQAKSGLNLKFDFITGKDFDKDLSKYKMIIHCGGCMVTEKEMTNRINFSYEKSIPITNYGMLIAYCKGILERSMELISNR